MATAKLDIALRNAISNNLPLALIFLLKFYLIGKILIELKILMDASASTIRETDYRRGIKQRPLAFEITNFLLDFNISLKSSLRLKTTPKYKIKNSYHTNHNCL